MFLYFFVTNFRDYKEFTYDQTHIYSIFCSSWIHHEEEE